MNRKKILIFLVSFFSLIVISNANPSLKREFRGAWIATIKNIDWPSSLGLPADSQKFELRKLFNSLHNAGINAVLFQVRTECDALYNSKIEPWSYWISGEQGKPPQPLYDPLKFAIKLARERGMEFHAWFNPYRVKADTAGYAPDSSHISLKKPDWIIQSGKYKFLNPGIPEVRNYVKKIVLDVLQRYDIDGVHFDDYFYPYTGITIEDFETFRIYGRGFDNIEDWRRDNINLFVRDIYENIKKIKPYIKFGISPFGIWKDGIPNGIKGFSAYDNIYCDAVYWLNEKIVDYIAPQIYWQTGGDQDYKILANWWSNQVNDRQLYIGHALYKMQEESETWKLDDISLQIKYNKQNQLINGSIFFRARDIQNNINGLTDSLKQNYYKSPSLIPPMPWIDSSPPPNFPFNLISIPAAKGIYLSWENPRYPFTKDQIKYNVVYRFAPNSEIDISSPNNILAILPASQSFYNDTVGTPGLEYTYLVTALDRLFNESQFSNAANAKYSRLEILSEIGKENILFDFNSYRDNKIKFSITKNELTNLSLFNSNGEKTYNLLSEKLAAGTYAVSINIGNQLSGKYYYKLTTPSFSAMKSFKIGIRK